MAYKIKKSVIGKVNNLEGRLALCQALNQGEDSIRNLLLVNQPNGNLTKLAALESIAETAGTVPEEVVEKC
jgi:hypothetical protein